MSQLDAIIHDLAAFEVQVKVLKESTTAQMKMIMSDMFVKFFDAFPTIKTVHWAQYTPYFNDGDECYFTLGSIEFNENEYGGIEDENFDEGDSFSVSKYSNHSNIDADLYRACIAVTDVLQNMGDQLENLLENHVQVFVTRRGIDVEEYEHE